MSIQWFNPMTDTPEGLLLGDVQSLLKAILEKKAKKAKKEQKPKPYKSDRGQRTMPNMPSPEGNKNKIDKTSEILQEMGIFVKNTTCSVCMSDEKNSDCSTCMMAKASMGEKDAYCRKNFQCNYSQCTPAQKKQCDNHCGKELKKYSQESSVENLFPKFQNVDGGMPVVAHGFTTNGTYPAITDGPKKSIISETAKIPAYAQNGYTAKSSSLHQHYNDAGGTRKNPPNIDTIEQRLASLTKHAGRNNLGMIGEIEGLLKQVKDLIENPSN